MKIAGHGSYDVDIMFGLLKGDSGSYDWLIKDWLSPCQYNWNLEQVDKFGNKIIFCMRLQLVPGTLQHTAVLTGQCAAYMHSFIGLSTVGGLL